MGFLVVPFTVVPILEIVVFVLVGDRVGIWRLIGLIVLTGVIGAFVAARQGASVWRQATAQITAGAFPGPELAHGLMVLVGGVLLITPGFVTDGVGFLLMVPAVREWVRRLGARRFADRVQILDI